MLYPKKKRIVNEELLEKIRNLPCCVCNKSPSDPHHIKSRGSGGGDLMHNLLNLCREHHTEIHKIGFTRFVQKYPSVALYLQFRLANHPDD